MKRADHQLITKSNFLIQETLDDLNRKEEKLMAILLADFKADYPTATSIEEITDRTTTVTLSEICNYLDIDIKSGTTQLYKETIRRFQNRAFYWVITDEDRLRRYPIFDFIEMPKHWQDDTIAVPDRDARIDFKWKKEFISLIIPNNNFTELFKQSILSLNSTYAIKLYQLLKSYSAKDWDTTITVADLRLKLGMTSKSYDVFKDFWKRGVEKPLEEINTHTELNVTAKKNLCKNDRRRVESITFKIKSNTKKYNWDDTSKRFPNVKLTIDEYNEIKKWNTYPDWKKCCEDLQKKLDEGADIRNHYKWVVGHHRELEEKHQRTLAAPKSQSADDEYRALFKNPYMNE